MKRITVALVPLVMLVGLLVLSRRSHSPTSPANFPPASREALGSSSNAPLVARPAMASVGLSARESPLLGEAILRDYARSNLPPEHDLTLVSQLMQNSLLLLKSAANRPLSANEDWASLWRGANAAHERFLPDEHPALNAAGQLVDRWGTPLFFHALGRGRYEVRSGGPDRTLWTADDIHRAADGSYRRGPDLNPESLYPGAAPPGAPGPKDR